MFARHWARRRATKFRAFFVGAIANAFSIMRGGKFYAFRPARI